MGICDNLLQNKIDVDIYQQFNYIKLIMLQHNGTIDVMTLFLAVILVVIFLLLVVGIKSIALNQAFVSLLSAGIS